MTQKYPNNEFFVLFDGEQNPEQIAEIIQQENIDFVFSCIGMKVQEQRLCEFFEYLPTDFPVVGLGVGASIDFLLGLQKRAPVFFKT